MKRPTVPTVAEIARMGACMCDDSDRKCSHCGWPFEVPGQHDQGAPVAVHCPRCGQPSTPADGIPRRVARALRRERGLVP